MFLSRNKKNSVYPCIPQFYYIKVAFKGVKIIKVCFRNDIYPKCWERKACANGVACLRHQIRVYNGITQPSVWNTNTWYNELDKILDDVNVRQNLRRTDTLSRENSMPNCYCLSHYENTLIEIYWKFHHQNWKFSDKHSDIFFPYFCSKHRLWYALEPPRRGGSNEYPQSMFLSRNKKKMYTPVNSSFTI